MTVIINELEVITQSAPEAPTPAATGNPRSTPVSPPFELRSVLTHMSRRADRLRAD